MPKRYLLFGFALILCLLALTCQRIAPPPNPSGFVAFNNIPASYGNLISVTTSPTKNELYVQLWFQDNVGTIRIVKVNFNENLMSTDVGIVTRN
jgi:hypothetical protein